MALASKPALYFVIVGGAVFYEATMRDAVAKAGLKAGDKFKGGRYERASENVFEMIDDEPAHFRTALNVPPRERYAGPKKRNTRPAKWDR